MVFASGTGFIFGCGNMTSQFRPHSLLDDVQGVVAGTLVTALGLAMFGASGLLTGGVAGIAFLLHYAFGVGYGIAFFLLSLPFVILAYKKKGSLFTLKTLITVALLSACMDLRHFVIDIAHIDPVFGGVMGGLLVGVGLLMLFRHNASVGGIGVLAIYCQEKLGWPAGNVQMTLDGVILGSAFLVLPWDRVLVSLLGALVLNMILTINHKPGRYTGM